MDAGFLSNKVILMLTPQAWGNMLLSKHHYALELAKRGNIVYFLNPPDNNRWSVSGRKSRIQILPSPLRPNLFLINQRLFFPYNFKYHARRLYNILIRKQIRDILSTIERPVDIVWSFDLGNLFPLSLFRKDIYKVFHPVDEPSDMPGILAGSGSDIIFSVTREILAQFSKYQVPAHFVNHGLAEEFFADTPSPVPAHERPKAGMSGNLLRGDLDRVTLLQIIRENEGTDFYFFGSYQASHSNIGASTDEAAIVFIETLKTLKNVMLKGVLSSSDLSDALNQMDALLICYDIHKDQSRGTNYHKVMEYLSTGKVIISNNITTYNDRPELIRMVQERDSNRQLPTLFRETMQDLEKCNAAPLREVRIAYAKNNSYSRQLDQIESLIEQNIL